MITALYIYMVSYDTIIIVIMVLLVNRIVSFRSPLTNANEYESVV